MSAGEAVDVLAVMNRARDVLAEIYAKHQLAIGPFASQAQKSNSALRVANAAVAELIEAAEFVNRARRLSAQSGNERGNLAAELGLDRSASLEVIRLTAGDRLAKAVLVARGDSLALALLAKNESAVARCGDAS